MLFLFFLILTVGAQDDDYFEELNPSKFKIFGPFRDPQIRITSTTETPSLDNETASDGNRTRDEFILGETLTAENHANSFGLPATQSTINYQCGCPATSQCVIPQPCTCAAPRPVCVPRPPPLCPPPPPPLVCPPPACPKPAPCPPCIQIPTLPPPCICPPTYSAPSQNECCCHCNVPCKTTRKNAIFGTKIRSTDLEPNLSRCNNQQMRQIIADNISSDLENTKHRIITAAQQLMGKTLNVICGHGEFSYIVQTQTYCQYSTGHTTCYVFQSI